jgi:hypothetical protein
MRKLLVVLLCYFVSSAVYAGQGHEKHRCTHENCKNCPCEAEKKEVEAQLKKVWGEVRTKLAAGDIEGALAFFDDSSRVSYRKTFTEMGKKDLAALFSKSSDIRLDDLHGDTAGCLVVCSGEEVNITYPVSFARNGKGEWKIKGFLKSIHCNKVADEQDS